MVTAPANTGITAMSKKAVINQVQQKIGIFDGGTAQLQLLGAFAEGGHFASGKETAFQDQLPVIVINLQIKVFFFVFCRYI